MVVARNIKSFSCHITLYLLLLRVMKRKGFPAQSLLCDLNVSPLISLQVLASILYKAAREGGYVQSSKVQEILGVIEEEVALPETRPKITSGIGPQETSTNESESDIPGRRIRTIDDPIFLLFIFHILNILVNLSFQRS